jgi:hypothetical protein
MDRDEAVFTATAMALAATQLLERLLSEWQRRDPAQFDSFAATTIGDLERVLDRSEAAVRDAPLGRQALFRNAAAMQLDLMRPLVRKR